MFKTRKSVEPTYVSYDERQVLKSLIKTKVWNTLNSLYKNAAEQMESVYSSDTEYQSLNEKINSIQESVKSFNKQHKGEGFKVEYTNDYYNRIGELNRLRNDLFRKHYPFEYRFEDHWGFDCDITNCVELLDTNERMVELRDITKAAQTVVSLLKELYS